MNIKPLDRQRFACRSRLAGRSRPLTAGLAATLLAVGLAGCRGQAPENVPPAKVEAVTAHGQTLDESATPQQVVYILLRTLVDDVEGAQAHDQARHKQAVDLTFSIAAYATIEKRVLSRINQTAPKKKTSLGDQRDARLYEVVEQWGSIVAHYIRSFDTDFPTADGKMRLSPTIESDRTVHVYYDVAHDPNETDPARQQLATLDIELAREPAGGKSYWRVARVAFLRPKPKPAKPAASATAPGS